MCGAISCARYVALRSRPRLAGPVDRDRDEAGAVGYGGERRFDDEIEAAADVDLDGKGGAEPARRGDRLARLRLREGQRDEPLAAERCHAGLGQLRDEALAARGPADDEQQPRLRRGARLSRRRGAEAAQRHRERASYGTLTTVVAPAFTSTSFSQTRTRPDWSTARIITSRQPGATAKRSDGRRADVVHEHLDSVESGLDGDRAGRSGQGEHDPDDVRLIHVDGGLSRPRLDHGAHDAPAKGDVGHEEGARAHLDAVDAHPGPGRHRLHEELAAVALKGRRRRLHDAGQRGIGRHQITVGLDRIHKGAVAHARETAGRAVADIAAAAVERADHDQAAVGLAGPRAVGIEHRDATVLLHGIGAELLERARQKVARLGAAGVAGALLEKGPEHSRSAGVVHGEVEGAPEIHGLQVLAARCPPASSRSW